MGRVQVSTLSGLGTGGSRCSGFGHALRLGLIGLVTIVVAGCSHNLKKFTSSTSDMGNSATPHVQGDLASFARAYDQRPGEKRASMAYAQALRQASQHAQALAVLQRASISNAGDREVAAAYGKTLADAGRFEEAMQVLAQAHSADRPDWRVLSTQGIVADQLGEHKRARDFYEQALQIAPNQPGVMTNLGLSYLLAKDLNRAEAILKQAMALPGADARVQANLAMVEKLKREQAAPTPRATRPDVSAKPKPETPPAT